MAPTKAGRIMTKSVENRVEWLDAVRGIAIVLVVLGHVWRGLNSGGLVASEAAFLALDRAIYLFHMPVFFILSGLLFEATVRRNGVAGSFIRRVETILYPLVLWSYVTAAFLYVAGSLTNRQLPLSELLTYPFPPKDIFWFLAALFVAQTLASVFVRYGSKRLYLGCFIVLGLPSLFLDLSGETMWIRKTIENGPLLFLGMAIADVALNKRHLALAGAVTFLGAQFIQYAVPELPQGVHYVLYCAAALGFVCACSWLFSSAAGWLTRPFSALGKASMTIYVTHVMAMAAIRIVLLKLGIRDLGVHLLVGTSLGVLLPYAFYLLCQRLGLMRILGIGRDRLAPAGGSRQARQHPSR
jgi:fucose 4-O-acetylase-like acetyltransferase